MQYNVWHYTSAYHNIIEVIIHFISGAYTASDNACKSTEGWGLVANTALGFASVCICHSTPPFVLNFIVPCYAHEIIIVWIRHVHGLNSRDSILQY